MPETYFLVRWPDGTRDRCYSPSLVVHDYFTAGTSYPLPEFATRSREALTIASERVRARYGMGCAHALAELAGIEARVASFGSEITKKAETVLVEGFEPCG